MTLVKVSDGSAICVHCSLPIPSASLMICKKRPHRPILHYHLFCWEPYFKEPLSTSTFEFINEQSKLKESELRARIDAWNRQFLVREEDLPAVYCSQAIRTSSTPLRRLLLLIYQYLTVEVVEARAALVCKAWYHVSRDSEGWKSRFFAVFRSWKSDPNSDYRKLYILYHLNSCWSCGCLPPLRFISTKCPYFKRPLCRKCAIQQPCSPTTIGRYAQDRCITMPLVATFNLPTFSHTYGLCNYRVVFAKVLVPYFTQAKAKLIAIIEQEFGQKAAEAKNQVEEFNVERYYQGYNSQGSGEKEIARMLGRKRKESSWKQSVRQLIRNLQHSSV